MTGENETGENETGQNATGQSIQGRRAQAEVNTASRAGRGCQRDITQ